jgi:hypothetical protein
MAERDAARVASGANAERRRKYHEANRDNPQYLKKNRASSRRYREANKDNPEFLEKDRKRARRYATENPEKVATKKARHRARKRDQLCPTANSEHIAQLERLKRHTNKTTGIAHHLEHHIPISALDMYTREDYVIACEKIGWHPDRKLHHEDNLYVMEGSANMSKSYKLPDRPIPATQDWLDALPIKVEYDYDIDWGLDD